MKKILSLITVAAVLITSCTSEVTQPSTSGTNSANSTVVKGNFAITKFTDSNIAEDKTAEFDGFSFTFNSNGTITAIKDGVTVTGSYTEKPEHEGEAAKLMLNFTGTPLDQISKGWQVNLISDSAIHLSDDSNASEVLEFSAQ